LNGYAKTTRKRPGYDYHRHSERGNPLKLLLTYLLVAAVLQQQAPTQSSSSITADDQQRMSKLIALGDGPYTKISASGWSTQYKGKRMATINVRVIGAGGGVFFFVTLFDRKTITLSRNLLLKIAELNSSFDYVKVALEDDSIQIRADVPGKLLDGPEFKHIEAQVAAAADEAYGILRDFIQ
jgi:hypothetical protein